MKKENKIFNNLLENDAQKRGDGFKLSSMIIISENGNFMVIWNMANIVLSIVSSYTFIWLAAFGELSHQEDGNFTYYLNMLFEVFFFVSMMLRFITDFVEEGGTEPVRDLKIISKRYLYSWGFFIDLFP